MKRFIKKFLFVAAAVATIFTFGGCSDGGNTFSENDKPIWFTVTYIDNGKVVKSEKVEKGDRATKWQLDDTDDYTFSGWTSNGQDYDFTMPVKNNISLVSKWNAVIHKVSFVCEGEVVAESTYTADDMAINFPELPPRNGYKIEWSQFIPNGGDVVITAQYIAVNYTIYFYEESQSEPLTILHYSVENEDFTLPSLKEKAGYSAEWKVFNIDGTNVYVCAEYTENASSSSGGNGENNTEEGNETPNPAEPEKPIEGTADLNYVYNSENDNYTIGAYEGAESKIVIPSLYNGKPVVAIDAEAFKNNSTITEVIICRNIETIGAKAFFGCSSLKNVTFADGITEIGRYAFQNCTSLTKAVLPDSVESIGVGAFSGSGLTEITLSKNIITLETYTFYSCTELKVIDIPASITKIENLAFAGCASLTCVNFLGERPEIELNAFLACPYNP